MDGGEGEQDYTPLVQEQQDAFDVFPVFCGAVQSGERHVSLRNEGCGTGKLSTSKKAAYSRVNVLRVHSTPSTRKPTIGDNHTCSNNILLTRPYNRRPDTPRTPSRTAL